MKKVLTPVTGAARLLGNMLLAAGLMAALPMVAQAALVDAPQSDFTVAAKEQSAREPRGLRVAAEVGLKAMLAELGQGIVAGTLPENFPFDVRDFSELRSATLGTGFEVHTVQPQQLLAGGVPLEQMVAGNGIWNFVVMVGKHPVALLEMAQENGRWQVQGAGAARLAQDIHQAAQTHGGKKAFRFVRIYQATSDLLEVQDSTSRARFVPLIAARETLHMLAPQGKDVALPSSVDLVPALQDAVRKNLAAHAKR